MNPKLRCFVRHLVAVPLGVAVARIGVMHFTNPSAFDAIVPAYLGWPRFWTLASGALEVLLGVGMVLPKTRQQSCKLFFVLVLLMTLANINMWWNDLAFDGTRLTPTGHLVRFGAQIVLLLALVWLARDERDV